MVLEVRNGWLVVMHRLLRNWVATALAAATGLGRDCSVSARRSGFMIIKPTGDGKLGSILSRETG
jgi:hypothetical protein